MSQRQKKVKKKQETAMLEAAPPAHECEKKEVSEEEKREIREAFDILDEDGDGKLSLDEMRTLLQSQFMVFTDAQANELLAELDTDKSGTIEFEEFEKYVIDNNLSKPTPEEFGSEMKEAFEMFDTDHNGYIDVEEFKTFMMTMGDQMTEEQVSEMMKEVDTNGDGKIDYKEFCTHMMNSI
ncbi:calmodulin-like protein [Plakobranchus ocellatus]|uniref:Calmodulin-like protein n=1 Tax=Plakobranchus ocellatus TaxID=259542 RepID=A0AAV3Z9X6_9GAST|nr:calmodulin-like protein [Plakobranchus ocellatus]